MPRLLPYLFGVVPIILSMAIGPFMGRSMAWSTALRYCLKTEQGTLQSSSRTPHPMTHMHITHNHIVQPAVRQCVFLTEPKAIICFVRGLCCRAPLVLVTDHKTSPRTFTREPKPQPQRRPHDNHWL